MLSCMSMCLSSTVISGLHPGGQQEALPLPSRVGTIMISVAACGLPMRVRYPISSAPAEAKPAHNQIPPSE